ncbi:MAG: hypothetical protein QXH71_03225 [Candidatus Anstonellaceae archaeon]
MNASDPIKGVEKAKRKTRGLAVLDQIQKIKEIKKQIYNFEGVPLNSIPSITLEERIPKEDKTNWLSQIPLLPPPQKGLENLAKKQKVEQQKEEKKVLSDNEIFFVNFEKIESETMKEEPQEVKRLLEYKVELSIEQNIFNFQPIEKIDYLILPQPSQNQIPLGTKIELREKEILKPQELELALKFEPLEKIQPQITFATPTQNIIPLKEMEDSLPQLKFEQINPPWLEFKKDQLIPKTVQLLLQEKKESTTLFYFENFQKITPPKITIRLFEKNPSFNYVELKTIAEIKEKEKQKIKEIETQSTPFGIEEIEKYLEVGKAESPNLNKDLTEQVEVEKPQKLEVEIGKKEIEEYFQFFLLQNNIINFLQNEPQYYYEKLPTLAKEIFKVVKIEQEYWQLVNKKSDQNYEKQKEEFIKKLDVLNIEQRILLEKLVKSSKALAALILILEQKENEQLINQIEKIYKKIFQDYPDIKLITEYRFAKYLFIKTFEKQEIGPTPQIKLILENFEKSVNNLFYCFWIILLDEIIKSSHNENLVRLAAEKYSEIMVKNPNITRELEMVKKIEGAVREFFFEERMTQINEPHEKEIIFYQISYLLEQMFIKRREKNG